MKKSMIISLFTGIALLGSVAPVAHAQVYSYSGAPVYTNGQSCLALTDYLVIGSVDAYTGGQVTQLQQFLNETGYLSGVSGTFDQGTYGAVYNYQVAHGIPATGTVGPETRAAIDSQSCSTTGYGVTTPAISSNSNSCYWSGSTYTCGYTNYPVGYQSTGYQYSSTPSQCSYYVNGSYNYSCGNSYSVPVVISSISNSGGYGSNTITIYGTGFSSNGNTVRIGSTLIPSVYSSNGSSLVVAIPDTLGVGNYSVSVTNAQGISSNSISYTLAENGSTYPYIGTYPYNGSYPNNSTYPYNQYGSQANNASVSGVSGPSSVQAGVTNTWNVTVTGASSNPYYTYATNVTVTANWGDNSGSNANDTQTVTNSRQNLSFAHTYEYPGTYTLVITATTAQGYTTSATYTVHVYSGGYYNYGY